TFGQKAIEIAAMLEHVLHLGRISGWLEIRHITQTLIWNGYIKAIAELTNRIYIQTFLLVRGVLSLSNVPHAVPFNGFCQNHSGLTLMLNCRIKSSKNLVRIMPSPI